MTKIRLDNLLVELNLAESRTKAQALIATGKVYSGEVKLDKAGHMVGKNTPLTVRGEEHPYVSRGGLKLAHALTHFRLNPDGMICADIGASTGGFTDVLLRNGAKKVYAVDVGHGQLDWKIRQDPRVVVMEKTNARYLSKQDFTEALDWVVCDASFISLKTVLQAPLLLTSDSALLIALIKPQFEVGKDRVGKGGIVKDTALHQEVCKDISDWLSGQTGWQVIGVIESPIKGPKGNTEFLICANKTGV